ncbi:hypothetical protein Tco_0178877 [Tanacetum coccineum]
MTSRPRTRISSRPSLGVDRLLVSEPRFKLSLFLLILRIESVLGSPLPPPRVILLVIFLMLFLLLQGVDQRLLLFAPVHFLLRSCGWTTLIDSPTGLCGWFLIRPISPLTFLCTILHEAPVSSDGHHRGPLMLLRCSLEGKHHLNGHRKLLDCKDESLELCQLAISIEGCASHSLSRSYYLLQVHHSDSFASSVFWFGLRQIRLIRDLELEDVSPRFVTPTRRAPDVVSISTDSIYRRASLEEDCRGGSYRDWGCMGLGIGDGDVVGDRVGIDHRDATDDTEEYEADANTGDTTEAGRRDTAVDLSDAVRDFYHHMSEVRVDRIVGLRLLRDGWRPIS